MFTCRQRMVLAAVTATIAMLFSGALSRAAEPAECALLNDPQAMASISGAAETALKVRCGVITLPAVPPPEPADIEPPPADHAVTHRVNNPATDTFPRATQSETNIAVSGSTVLAGFNDSGQFLTLGDFTGYGRSTDDGTSWTDMGAPTTPLGPVAAVFGDPVLVADRVRASGQTAVFYFANLADNTSGTSIISVHKTINGGTSWAQAANASPSAAGGQFQDKEWMAVDTRASGTGAGNIYVCWRRFGGANGIQFSRSTNGGATFAQLAANLSSTATDVQGCTVAVNPLTGHVYVAWLRSNFSTTGEIRFRRSTDAGLTFGPEISVSGGTFPLAETTTNCGGSTRTVFLDSDAGATGRAVRSIPFPHMAVNPTNGHIFVVWHRGGLAGGSGADIAFARSTNGGGSFGATSRINNDTAGHQFFPSIAVNTSGRIEAMYYSTVPPTNRLIRVRRVVSTDSGVSFGSFSEVSNVAFNRPTTNPNFDPLVASCYMGDYNHVTAPASGLGGTRFYYAWGDNRDLTSGQPDPNVYFDRFGCGLLAFASHAPSTVGALPVAIWFAGPFLFVGGWKLALRRKKGAA